ncbi:hypothetical protein TrVE_jg11602 [Triparma verrucosa]|uniref:Myb-like domain-containing protein n=1 Tax=Triparma verrucosa TaxID=1606542 RepID=A0A9W7BGJ4_9STRA|nr:hypothetical protein TrVE_jg11602 [Triparma verrucosa]
MNAVRQEESDLIDIDVKVEYLMDIKREEGYFDESNEDGGGVGGDDVGGGEVVVKEEEVEEVVEEVDVGVNWKTEEETKPRKSKKKRRGSGCAWMEEEDDALLKGAGKYGRDFKRIKKEDDGNVFADRTPVALYKRLINQYPARYKEARAATPLKRHNGWTAEEVETLKRGMKKYGRNWDEIHKCR